MTTPLSPSLRLAPTGLAARLPTVRGTRCGLCHYEVPALGQDPDAEMAWFERFEGRPCPRCVGTAVGVVAGLVLAAVTGLRRPRRG